MPLTINIQTNNMKTASNLVILKRSLMVDGNIAAMKSVKRTEVFENMLTIATGAKESAS